MLPTEAYPHGHHTKTTKNKGKLDKRRGINLATATTKKLPEENSNMIRELEDILKEEEAIATPYSTYTEIGKEDINFKDFKLKFHKLVNELNPAYPCDEWDSHSRTCIFDRNIGDTVTFVLNLPHKSTGTISEVVWKQEFHVLYSNTNKQFTIDPGDPPWNMVIGSGSSELRLSPITEIDIDFNYFSATLLDGESTTTLDKRKIYFKIRAMPIDQGTLYPGAFVMLNMLTFVSLPQESMTFKWYMEKDGESGTLPSNMRHSLSGGLLVISELRKEQEGIIVCSVYTNLGVFATKKRFLIKEVDQDNNKLVFVPTRPIDHRTEFLIRGKRELEYDDDMNEHFKEPIIENENNNENRVNQMENSPNFKIHPEEIDSELFSEIPINNVTKSKSGSTGEIFDYQSFYGQESNIPVVPNRTLSNSNKDQDNSIHKQKHFQEDSRTNDISKNALQNYQLHRRYRSKDNDIHRNMINFRHKYATTDSILNVAKEGNGSQLMTTSSSKELQNDDLVVELEDDHNVIPIETRDKLSLILSRCNRDFQCSIYAICIRTDKQTFGFCRCLPRFEGNGIFCWEDYKFRT